MEPEPTPTTAVAPSARRPRVRRVLAIAVGVAMVPALYAVASAATSGGGGGSSTVAARAQSARVGSELETEHGVVVVKPHGGSATPTPTVPEVTSLTVPEVTTPTTPEREVEHPVPEPGDDKRVKGAATPIPAGDRTFSSAGGSITVAVTGSTISLASSTPAAGFVGEVHDNGPTEVNVRFSDGTTEWRIRVELGRGGLSSEIIRHR